MADLDPFRNWRNEDDRRTLRAINTLALLSILSKVTKVTRWRGAGGAVKKKEDEEAPYRAIPIQDQMR